MMDDLLMEETNDGYEISQVGARQRFGRRPNTRVPVLQYVITGQCIDLRGEYAVGRSEIDVKFFIQL